MPRKKVPIPETETDAGNIQAGQAEESALRSLDTPIPETDPAEPEATPEDDVDPAKSDAISETDMETTAQPSAEAENSAEKVAAPQTETEQALLGPGSAFVRGENTSALQTDSDKNENLHAFSQVDALEQGVSQTDLENTQEQQEVRTQDASTADKQKTEIKSTRRRGATAPAADDDSPVSQTETETDAPDTIGRTSRRRTSRARGSLAIDGGRSELTDEAKRRSELIDLTESLKSRRILTGTIQGVESVDGSANPSYAVSYKIIIPLEELVSVPEEAQQNYRSALVARRLGAEIDYIVKGIDQETGIAAGSRLEAMRMRQREYYIRTGTDGNPRLNEGDLAEARVVCVLRRGMFVELFGVEAFVPIVELSHLRMLDATEHFTPGERVLAKILQIDRSDAHSIQLELSIKQANEDSLMRALERYIPGNLYVGTVSMITTAGVFVTLDGVSCLCQFPQRGRPVIGARVTVKVRGTDLDRKRIWGVIIR